MPTWSSLASFGTDLQRLALELSTTEKATVTRAMGRAGRPMADAEAQRSLGGDRAFSGWRRGKPIPLDTHLVNARAGATIMAPTKRSAGPWTVANRGRNQGETGRLLGPGISQKTGLTPRTKAGNVRKVRAFKPGRWNGTTRPMHTADRAIGAMERKLPDVADKAVRRVIAKRFDVT